MPGELATLLTIGSDIGNLVTGLNAAMMVIDRVGGAIRGIMDSIVKAGENAVQSLMRVAQSIRQLSAVSARLDSMRDSFNKMTAEFGVMGQELLSAMREATLGMTKDADLIQSAMTGMMLISKEAMGDVTETIPMFAKIATSAARALGEDVGFMFSSLVRGIGRASPMILDNLGFTIKLGEVYGDFAKQLGKTTKELTTVEKQQALINVVMEQGVGYVEQLGISTGGLATKQKQLRTEIENLCDVMGQSFMPLVQALQGLWSDVATTIISRVIPAFRTLGRVFSEVFGTKNPFMRWIEGDISGKTAQRIQDIEENIETIREMGPDFMGGVTEAWDEFNEGVAELDEKFGPRLAKVNQDLADRVADIWEDHALRQARRQEDIQREDERRLEDHKERLKDIEERYTWDIADAIRKRDARALLNLLRKQRKEESAVKEQFEKDQDRREADRKLEAARAKEDAQRREADARESAAKQTAAIQSEYEKANAKLAETRDKAIAAAEKAWEAELKGLADNLQKQKELIIKQIMEENKIRRQMEQPPPPFWQKLSVVLSVVWGWLQKIRNVIVAIVEDPSVSNILAQLGLSPEKLGEISAKFLEIKNFILGLGESIKAVFGPEAVAIWDELKVAWASILTIIPPLITLFRELAPVLVYLVEKAVSKLVTHIVLATAAFRAFVSGITMLIRFATTLVTSFLNIVNGVISMIKGTWEVISGIFTGNTEKILDGLRTFSAGFQEIFTNTLNIIIETFLASFMVIGKTIQTFVFSAIDMFTRLKNTLVGRSIVPDMMRAIESTISKFLDSIGTMWSNKWNGFVDTIRTVWGTISDVVGGTIESIKTGIGSWIEDVKETVQEVATPIRDTVSNLAGNNYGYNWNRSYNTTNQTANIYNYGRAPERPVRSGWSTITDLFSDAGSAYEAWTRA